MTNKEYVRGLKAALKQVRRKPALKSAKSINEHADMAGMDSAEVFSEACAELQHDIDQRICRLILAETDKALPNSQESVR